MDSRQLQLVLKLQDQASAELRKVSGELGNVDKAAKGTSSGFMGMAKSIAGVAAAYVSFQSVYSAFSVGVTMAADMQTAQVGLTTLLGSAEEAAETVARLKVESARTPFELPGLTQATQLLTSVTKDGNKSIDIILDIGEGLAAMGKGQNELDRIIVNLQQIAATGKAATIDIKQFAFAGIPIYEMLAETTGKTGDEVAAMVENGEISFDLLTKMFDEANDAGGRFHNAFVNQSGTFNQAASNMKDSFGIMMGDIVTSTGIFDTLTQSMIGVAGIMGDWRGTIADVTNWVKENGLVLSMLAGAITAVLIPTLIAGAIAFGTFAAAAIAGFAAAAIAAAPFLIVGALIAGLAYLIITNWDGIKVFFSDLWASIVEMASKAMTWMTDFFTGVWDGIKNVFWTAIQFIIGAYAMLFDFLLPGWQGMLTGVFEKTKEVFDFVLTYVGEIIAKISEVLGGWYAIVKEGWNGAWTSVKETFQTLWDAIREIFISAKDGISDTMDELIRPIQKVIDLAREALELAGKAVSGSKKFISGGIQSILDRGSDFIGPKRATGGPVVGGLMHLVGEKGPEQFVPSTSGRIIPNNRLGLGGGANLTVIVNGDVTGEEIVEKVGRVLMQQINQRIRTT